MLYIYLTIPNPRDFLRSILGRCLLTIISGILFRHKGFSIYYPEDLFSHWLRAQRLVCEVILGVVGNVICFTIFLGNSSRKKRFFEFTKPICPCSLSNLCRHMLHAMILWILNSKSWGFEFKARGLWTRVISDLFFKFAGR
jgi:hypothetical protein